MLARFLPISFDLAFFDGAFGVSISSNPPAPSISNGLGIAKIFFFGVQYSKSILLATSACSKIRTTWICCLFVLRESEFLFVIVDAKVVSQKIEMKLVMNKCNYRAYNDASTVVYGFTLGRRRRHNGGENTTVMKAPQRRLQER